MTPTSPEPDVLIVGAGPTGLVLALWLTRLGIRVRIVDKTAEPGTTSRALAVQARTLEFYRQVGLADVLVDRGRKFAAANLWVAGKRAGTIHGGDRLPWVPPDSEGGEDNFTPLTSLDWQIHVYGAVAPEIRAICSARGLPLHVFGWRPTIERTGLKRDAAYLVRPDGYVALAEPEASAAKLQAYLDERGVIPLAH